MERAQLEDKEFDIELNICHDTPLQIYRVQCLRSRTVYTIEEGFKASDTTRIFGTDNLREFKTALEKQFTRSCRDPVPFISLFSDLKHAENWRLKRPLDVMTYSPDNWALYTIDATALKQTTLIFKLSTLVDALKLAIPQKAQQHVQGAYLCLHRISPSTIINKHTPAQVEEGTFLI